jgi:hypothetical protein
LKEFLKEQVATHIVLFEPTPELAERFNLLGLRVLATDEEKANPDDLVKEYIEQVERRRAE